MLHPTYIYTEPYTTIPFDAKYPHLYHYNLTIYSYIGYTDSDEDAGTACLHVADIWHDRPAKLASYSVNCEIRVILATLNGQVCTKGSVCVQSNNKSNFPRAL